MTDIGKRKNVGLDAAEFIAALKRLDTCAWETLYTDIHRELHRFLRQKLDHRHEDMIEDCIQEAFMRAYASIQSFEGKSSIKTWVMSIARYVALDEVRSVERKRGVLQEPVSVKSIQGHCHRGPGPDPEKSASQHELEDKLWDVIKEELPPRHYEMIYPVIRGDQTEEEGAEALGVPRGTASSYIAQAKKHLRECCHRFTEFR